MKKVKFQDKKTLPPRVLLKELNNSLNQIIESFFEKISEKWISGKS